MTTSEERRLDTQLPNWREYLRLGRKVVEEREALRDNLERHPHRIELEGWLAEADRLAVAGRGGRLVE